MITLDHSTKRTGIPGRGEREGFRLRKLVAAYRVLFITEPGSYIEGTLVLHSNKKVHAVECVDKVIEDMSLHCVGMPKQ